MLTPVITDYIRVAMMQAMCKSIMSTCGYKVIRRVLESTAAYRGRANKLSGFCSQSNAERRSARTNENLPESWRFSLPICAQSRLSDALLGGRT
jgi:hypothetical protein